MTYFTFLLVNKEGMYFGPAQSNGNLELCGCDNVRATSWVKALGKVAFVEVARTPNKLCELRRFLSSVSIHGITYHPVAFNINVPGHHFAVARIGELWVSLDSYMHKVSSASPISPTVLATKHHAQITTILYARDGPLLRQESINLNEPAAPAVGVLKVWVSGHELTESTVYPSF